jgi:hypothetical protein
MTNDVLLQLERSNIILQNIAQGGVQTIGSMVSNQVFSMEYEPSSPRSTVSFKQRTPSACTGPELVEDLDCMAKLNRKLRPPKTSTKSSLLFCLVGYILSGFFDPQYALLSSSRKLEYSNSEVEPSIAST